MATPVYRGLTAPIINKQVIRSDPQRGTTIITDITGISYPQILAAYNQFYANGVEVELTTQGGFWRIHANDATQNNPIDSWELQGATQQFDLFYNPKWGYLAGTLNENQMLTIRYYLANNTPAHGTGSPTTGGAFDAPPSGNTTLADLSSLSGGIIERAYSRYKMGNDQFENDAMGAGYAITHTSNIPNRYVGPSGTDLFNTNVGLVYSTAAVLSEISNSSAWVLPVSTGSYFYQKINILGSNPPSFNLSNYFWGWKKGRQDIAYAANNRLNVVQHYTLGLWNTEDYGTFT